jgi:hypothetical protein
MDWSKVLNGLTTNLFPLVIPLLISGIAWITQGWVLVKPKEKKEVGKELIKGGKYMLIIAAVIFILFVIAGQLAIWLPHNN